MFEGPHTWLLSYSMAHCVVLPFTIEDTAQVMSCVRESQVSQPVPSHIFRYSDPLSWPFLCRWPALFMIEACGTALLTSFPNEPVLVAPVVAFNDWEHEHAPNEPVRAIFDGEAIRNSQCPLRKPGSTPAPDAFSTQAEYTVSSVPRPDPPSLGGKPVSVNIVADLALGASIPVSSKASVVVSKCGRSSCAAVPSRHTDEGDQTSSGPTVLKELINCNQESCMSAVTALGSHNPLLFSGIDGSSTATYSRVFGSRRYSSPVRRIVRASLIVSAPVCRSLQYLCDRRAHCDAEFADLDACYIKRKKIVTVLEACLHKVHGSLDASSNKCSVLRAAKANATSECHGARQRVT